MAITTDGKTRTERETSTPRIGLAWVVAATAAVARHPSLWTAGLRQIIVLAEPGWWRRRPYLPLPDPAYLGFRLQTAYGDPGHAPDPADVVTYLRWCRDWPY